MSSINGMSVDHPCPPAETAAVPAVSVVVIVYNDASRLTTAVRSVLDQTLRGVEVVIVDDRSTDGSYDVAQRLAAAHPDRVQGLPAAREQRRLQHPRNHGIQQARGDYVLFLDSDDVLERNACRNMLEAAESTGAGPGLGLCVRVHVDSRTGKEVKWYPWLYDRTRTLESISELPDLLVFDTLSTNKCYRRRFLLDEGLEFPVGIHYEDLLFSAQAYVAARRITLIPNRVYEWRIVDKPKTAVKSISNRRDEIANFTHRMEIHRRVDQLLASHGLLELKFAKDVKWLKHDLVLHLRELPFRDETYRRSSRRSRAPTWSRSTASPSTRSSRSTPSARTSSTRPTGTTCCPPWTRSATATRSPRRSSSTRDACTGAPSTSSTTPSPGTSWTSPSSVTTPSRSRRCSCATR